MIDRNGFLRIGVRIGGVLLVGISLFFVAFKLWSSWEQIFSLHLTTGIVSSILLGSLLYALNCFLLSLAWQRLLVQCGQADARFNRCHVVYARTQIAKYIPGNIFHFAGRHLLGNSAGFQHVPLAGAALYEILGLLFASGLIASLGIVCFDFAQKWAMTLALAVIILLVPFAPLLFQKVLTKLAYLQSVALSKKKTLAEITKELIPTYCLYFFFFLISGGILWGLVATMVGEGRAPQSGLVFAASALSWIAGVLTPGAPAGIGVRETVIIVLLSSVIGEPKSLLAAVLFRTITVLGDGLFFLSSYLNQRFDPSRSN